MTEGLQGRQFKYFYDLLKMANSEQLHFMAYEILVELHSRSSRGETSFFEDCSDSLEASNHGKPSPLDDNSSERKGFGGRGGFQW